jgi:hypothetical protein
VTDKPPEWAIRCPWCKAPVGARCTTQRGRRHHIASHDARITAARQHTGDTT